MIYSSFDRWGTGSSHIEATIIKLMGNWFVLELGSVSAISLQSFRSLHDYVSVIIFKKSWINTEFCVLNWTASYNPRSNWIFWRWSLPFDVRGSWCRRSFWTFMALLLASVGLSVRTIMMFLGNTGNHVHMRLEVLTRLRPLFLLLRWVMTWELRPFIN